jgi:glycosyltransferase involved in cell wall biosynthesis
MANITIIAANAGMIEGQYGGAERSFKLAESFGDHNVVVLMASISNKNRSKNINSNLKFIEVNEDMRTCNEIGRYAKSRCDGNIDIAMYGMRDKLVNFKREFSKQLQVTDILILDHVGAAALMPETKINIPIIYASHNCEADLAEQMYQNKKSNIKLIKEMEKLVLSVSDAFTYCSKDDAKKIKSIYNIKKPSFYIPNGAEERYDVTNRLQGSNDILFIGSGHGPNVDAANSLIPLAKEMSEYKFHIVGKCGLQIEAARTPKNFIIHGHVEEAEMDRMFRSFFAFINPMQSGSGTHLKVMRAMSYGIPIISSSMGLRGFDDSEINETMLVANTESEMIKAMDSLQNKNTYKKISSNTIEASKNYLWSKIQKEFKAVVESFLITRPAQIEEAVVDVEKIKVLIYSIIRNRGSDIQRYYDQLKLINETFTDHEFYLSIYENDSTDFTKEEIFSKDWSIFKRASIISENIGSPYFGSVKDETRVMLLSNARNKAVMAAGFVYDCDYVLMVEGDVEFDMNSISRLLNFKRFEPDFDVVSAVSLRPNGKHYDWWATRTTAKYKEKASELDPHYRRKEYGPYYATSNGLCLYKAEPFKKGVLHGWVNLETNEFDCEMVVLCQNFRNAGFEKIFIDYRSIAQH